MSLSTQARRARLLALRDTIDATGPGAVWLMDGTQPANADTATSTTPISAVTLANPCAALGTGAVLDLVPAVGFAARMGTPTWVRVVDATGAAVLDASAGPPGSGAAFVITNGDTPPSAQLYTGGQVTITAQISDP